MVNPVPASLPPVQTSNVLLHRLICKRRGLCLGALAPKSLNIFTHLFSLLVFILKDSRNTSAIYTGGALDLTWTRGGGREN